MDINRADDVVAAATTGGDEEEGGQTGVQRIVVPLTIDYRKLFWIIVWRLIVGRQMADFHEFNEIHNYNLIQNLFWFFFTNKQEWSVSKG